jgi:hypothetical protein
VTSRPVEELRTLLVEKSGWRATERAPGTTVEAMFDLQEGCRLFEEKADSQSGEKKHEMTLRLLEAETARS